MDPRDFFTENGLPIVEIASRWGVSHTTLYRVLNGQQWPSADIMLRVDELSKGRVTLEDWARRCAPYLERNGVKQHQKVIDHGRTRKAQKQSQG